jgi:hypothetical protein
MAQTYKPKDTIQCPHCNEDLEGVAEDFVIPGRFGSDSACDEMCGHCDGEFRCLRLSNGDIEVEEIEKEED